MEFLMTVYSTPALRNSFLSAVSFRFRIAYGIRVSADLKIPEVFSGVVHVGNAVEQIFGGVMICPFGRDERTWTVFLPRLDHAAHAHGLPVAG